MLKYKYLIQKIRIFKTKTILLLLSLFLIILKHLDILNLITILKKI